MGDFVFSAIEFLNCNDVNWYVNQWYENTENRELTQEDLQILRASLKELDEVRLSVALAVFELNKIQDIGLDIVGYLNHESLSVRVNTYRLLKSIEISNVDATLIARFEEEIGSCPEKKEFADALSCD